MKTSKIFIIAVLLCVSSFAQGQTSKEIEAKAKAKTEKLVKALDLTENQEMMIYRQVYGIVQQSARYAAVEDKTTKIEETYKRQMTTSEETVQSYLTDDQKVIFDKVWSKTMK